MPAGKHSSVRVALAVPPKIHEALSEWAEHEGRPVAQLCMYLIENSLREAQRDGLAPSFRNPEPYEKGNTQITKTMNDKEFEEYYKEQYGDLTKGEEPSADDMARMVSIRESQGIGKKKGKLTRAMESSPERPDMPPEALAAGAAAAIGMAVGGPVAGAAAAVGAGVVLNQREQLVAKLLNLLEPSTSEKDIEAVKVNVEVVEKGGEDADSTPQLPQ